jgi:hypothetical protein
MNSQNLGLGLKVSGISGAIALALAALTYGSDARADGYWESVRNNALTVLGTANGDLTVDQEVDRINSQWDRYNAQRRLGGILMVPQARLFNPSAPSLPIYPLYRYDGADPPLLSMDYSFIDPATGLDTSAAFVPFQVRYQVLSFPGSIDPSLFVGLDEAGIESLIRPLLTEIGSSTDASNRFRINFDVAGFEPILFAFPFDASGNEIRGVATAGWISTVQVPEPSTWTVLIIGFGAIGANLRRRRRLAAGPVNPVNSASAVA